MTFTKMRKKEKEKERRGGGRKRSAQTSFVGIVRKKVTTKIIY